jgi:hypothetical protein
MNKDEKQAFVLWLGERNSHYFLKSNISAVFQAFTHSNLLTIFGWKFVVSSLSGYKEFNYRSLKVNKHYQNALIIQTYDSTQGYLERY